MVQVVEDLPGSIERLYLTFSSYPFPSFMHASPIRDPAAILAALRSAPLREIDAAVLSDYARQAMTTIGSADDFRHFLPRIVELSIFSSSWQGFQPEIVASKLTLADWREWSTDQQRAIGDVAAAAWLSNCMVPPSQSVQAWPWICFMAKLALPFEDCLMSWTNLRTSTAMLQLADGRDLIGTISRSGNFWSDVEPKRRALIMDWLFSDRMEATLVEGIDLVPPADRWTLETMLDNLDELKRAAHNS